MKVLNKLIILLYFLQAGLLVLNAQSTQKVKVLEYRGEQGKRPLADVEVVVGNALAATSGEDGCCTLNFRSLKPGDKVLVRRISRPGYVVFNQDALNQWRVSENAEMVVVVCEQQFIMDTRERYKKAVSVSLEKDLESRKHEIISRFNGRKLSQAEYDAEMNDLYIEQAEKLEEMEAFIEKFVYIDIEEITETEKNALEMIGKGDVLGAIRAYETNELLDDYREGFKTLNELADEARTVREKKEESVVMRDKAYEQVKRHVALLRFQGGQDNIDRSFKLLHDIAYSDTTNYQVLLDYASYCTKCYNYSEAEAALKLCYNATDSIIKVQTYINQSVLNNRRREYRKSAQILEKVCKYLKETSVSRNAPTLYLAERVNAMLTLVSSYNSLRDSIGSSTHREELITLSNRYFEQKNDNESKRMLVESLYHAYFGYFFYKNDYIAQLDGFNEAMRLQEELYKEDPIGQTAMLAFLHSALANTYSRSNFAQKDYDRAMQERQKAIDLYEEIYPKNPKAYIGYLGSGYRTLANNYLDYKPKEINKALPLMQKAEYYINEELRMSPEIPHTHIANILYTYAQYYYMIKDFDSCEHYAVKALNEYIPLFENTPKSYDFTVKNLYRYIVECLDKKPGEEAKAAAYRKQCEEKGLGKI